MRFQLLDKMPISIVVQRAISQLFLFDEILVQSRRQQDEFEYVFRDSEFAWNAIEFTAKRPFSVMEFECLFKSLEFNMYWRTVSIRNCEAFDNTALSSLLHNSLRHNTHLHLLDLSSNFLSDEAVTILSQALAQTLPSVSSLKILNLSRNQISRRGVESLFDALKFVLITSLNISDNLLDETCSSVVSECLVYTSLTSLDVSMNAGVLIDYCAVKQSLLEVLHVGYTNCLKGDQYLQADNLKELHVETCNISDVGLVALVGNSTLNQLNISQNELLQNRSVMTVFGETLRMGASNLVVLNLSEIRLDDVVPLLMNGVQSHESLEHLIMRRCELSAFAIRQLVASLLPSSKLHVLDVSQNNFGIEGVRALLHPTNHGLKDICVACCGISTPADELSLLELVSIVNTLDSLDVSGNFRIHQHKFDMVLAKSSGEPDLSPWY
ncbi:UNVERIFIED_CONTAM: hypothetical protein HDU68_003117 [Siphonaria sp. JEL0065]|nr:hypothetical protein HDU68_003117 [Siphonaria sp. JEL0065]